MGSVSPREGFQKWAFSGFRSGGGPEFAYFYFFYIFFVVRKHRRTTQNLSQWLPMCIWVCLSGFLWFSIFFDSFLLCTSLGELGWSPKIGRFFWKNNKNDKKNKKKSATWWLLHPQTPPNTTKHISMIFSGSLGMFLMIFDDFWWFWIFTSLLPPLESR